MSKRIIMVLGPCRKVDRKGGGLFEPFALESRSGKFIRGILQQQALNGTEVRFDNILSTAYFDETGQERNPAPDKLVAPLLSHACWSSADVVIALSSGVKAAFELAERRGLPKHKKAPIIRFLDHPSYIMRRPQAERTAYANRLLMAVTDQ